MKKCFLLVVCCIAFACFGVAHAAKEKVVNVYNWSEYIPQEVLDQFTKETGIKVVYTTYESNEAMYAKLKLLGGKGYDVVVPSTYFVDLMQENGLLSAIDKQKLPNLKYLDEEVVSKATDSKDNYSIPYMWGAQGFMVNSKAVDVKSITSWNDLMRPEFKGKLLISDDLRDTFGAALLATGSSINTKDPKEILKAYEWLAKLKPSVRIFDVTAAKQALISGEVVAGFIWNGDAYIAKQENPDLEFVYPKEGMPLWLDSFVIPAHAENKNEAHAFINFILRPDIAAKCVAEYNYTTPNTDVKKHLDKDMAESKLIFPTKAEIKNSEFTKGLGDVQKVYEKYWEELKIGE